MHTVELLEEAIAVAVHNGIRVRQDWFGGAPAGACEVRGQRWIFVDLALSVREQLDQVLEGLRQLPAHPKRAPGPVLLELIEARKAA